jgi:hypothetical protein
MAQKESFFGAVRRRTFICCRSTQISASSAARDRIRSTTIQPMSLQRSLITQQHRPILDQPPARLGLRQGQRLRCARSAADHGGTVLRCRRRRHAHHRAAQQLTAPRTGNERPADVTGEALAVCRKTRRMRRFFLSRTRWDGAFGSLRSGLAMLQPVWECGSGYRRSD